MRKFSIALAFTGLCALATLLAFGQGSASAPTRAEIVELHDVMIPMRDGVRLATDIFLPGRNGAIGDGKFPVVLNRGPYNKEVGGRQTADYYVPRGYAYIVQDVRGRYKSEGRWIPIRDDVNDGVDTAKWIGSQSWSDGSIGTIGSSYNGATQHAMAIGNAPYLKAMVPRNAMSNFGRYGVRHNGAFELRFFNWVLNFGNPSGGAELTPPSAARPPLNLQPFRLWSRCRSMFEITRAISRSGPAQRP